MINFKKALALISLILFLCQEIAFCLPYSNSTLRPILTTSKTFKEFGELQNPERTPEDIISELDKSNGYLWSHLKNNETSREIMRRRLKYLLEDKNLPQLVKDKLKSLKKEGRIELSDEDIENCTIFIFGDSLWYSEKDRPNDIDMLIIVKGRLNFTGKEWSLSTNLPAVNVKIRGEEDFNTETKLRKHLSLLRLSTEVAIYGKDSVRRFALSPAEIIEWTEGLIENGFRNDESAMVDLGDPRKEWKKFLQSYIYMYPLFVDYMPQAVKEISDKFLGGENISDYFVSFYNGEIEELPWRTIGNEKLGRFGRYLAEKTAELKKLLDEMNLLNVKILIEGDKGVIELKMRHYPDGELYLRILNPGIVNGASLTVTSPLDTSEDLVRIILSLGTLKRNNARKIGLVLDKAYDIKNGLDSLLRFYCDRLFCDTTESSTTPLMAIKKKEGPYFVRKVLYEHTRLESDAKEAADSIEAVSERVIIEKPSENPLTWNVNIPDNLEGENAILVHSAENFNDFAELWVMLIALRAAGLNSISLINTYEGYSRQDKEFNPGESLSAATMLEILEAMVDNHMALNVHYADSSGYVKNEHDEDAFFNEHNLYNLNTFVQLGENLLDRIAKWAEGEEKKFADELKFHPLLLVSPDDGAFGYMQEASVVLKKYIKKHYGITNINMHVGYMEKKRLGPEKVVITGLVLGQDGQPITDIPNIKDCWVIILDDEISRGTTARAATYTLVRKIGVSWHRILIGAVHGKFSGRMTPFITGYGEGEITTAVKQGKAIEPKAEYIDEKEEYMPPRLVVVTKSVALPKDIDFPKDQSVSIGPIIVYAAKKIIGKNILLRQLNDRRFAPANDI